MNTGEIALVWYYKGPKGWRRTPVLMAQNGRIRTGIVIIDGVERKFSKGRFQLRTYDAKGNNIYINAGTNATEALLQRDVASKKRKVRRDADAAGVAVVPEAGQTALSVAIQKFIDQAISRGSTEAAATYTRALDEFVLAVDARFIHEVKAETVTQFQVALRRKGNGDRTVSNKTQAVISFLLNSGVDTKALKIRKVKYEKKLPVVYGKDDIDALVAATGDPYLQTVIALLRMTGLREQEAMYLAWTDLDLSRKTLRVQSKPAEGFRIKDKEERDIPLPDILVGMLKLWREGNPNTKWVVGTSRDQPNTKLLRTIKRLAGRAGLNCGTCTGCERTGECRRWTLHSFRRSYATTLSRGGVDNRTIMALMGHSDLATVLRYLAPMETEQAGVLVNAVAW